MFVLSPYHEYRNVQVHITKVAGLVTKQLGTLLCISGFIGRKVAAGSKDVLIDLFEIIHA